MKTDSAYDGFMSDRSGTLNLKGILIDFGDTLAYVDEEENRRYEEALYSILKKQGYKLSLDHMVSTLDGMYRDSSKGGVKSVQEFWALLLMKLDMPERKTLIKDLEVSRTRLRATIFKLYEGVFPALSALKKKYKLALVSNCAVGTREIVNDLGLTSFFEHFILSYEVGARKPDSRIFLQALQSLGLAADECVFVADEISDLEGARAVGMKTMLVSQGQHTFDEAEDLDFKPDFQCKHISEIVNLL